MPLNKRSQLITQGVARSPNRAMLRAVGFGDRDFSKPIIGGPIALVRNGDSITIDAVKRLIQLNVPAKELAARRRTWKQPQARYKTGVLAKYTALVSTASRGAVTD